jgi:NAD(P)-dependent dehydrogenase (short-subunit alcohol dehydrogenase family)
VTEYLAELFGVHGKTAVVTGGGQGIGRMIAEGFVRAGARTIIASRKLDVCEQAAAELAAFGTCIPMQADLGTTEGCLRFAAQLRDAGEAVHVLVNNAGATWGAPYEEYPAHAWNRCMELNVHAVFELTRALTPDLAATATADDPARVINIGSIDGMHVPIYENYAYAASKAALHHLTTMLAGRLAPRNITVNTVAPGPFESKMMRSTLEEHGADLVTRIPLGRIGRSDDMAGIALYLASRAGAYLTGALIPVDGGLITTR